VLVGAYIGSLAQFERTLPLARQQTCLVLTTLGCRSGRKRAHLFLLLPLAKELLILLASRAETLPLELKLVTR